MGRQFRKLDQAMISFGDKEAAYDGGPAAWTAPAAYQCYEFGEGTFAAWDDTIVTDRDSVHGSIHATKDEIVHQDLRIAYSVSRVKPTELAGFLSLVGGVSTPTQDGALTAYSHKVVNVDQDDPLPSVGVEEKASGEQYKYTGVCCDSLSLRRGGPNRAYWELAAALIGSGTRAVAADAFVAKVTEAPFLWGKTQVWLETGANITIAATPAQGAENISSSTPDALTERVRDVTVELRNDLQADLGYTANSGKVRTALPHGPGRTASVSLVCVVDPSTLATERGYYENRDNVAVEIQCDMGVLIAGGGAMKFGFDLIIPRLRLKPIARSVDQGVNLLTFAGDAFDDGTNPIWIGYAYCAQAAFLA